MNKEAAVKKLYEDVYLPRFVKRASDLGIAPDSDESLDEMLNIALKIKRAGFKPTPRVTKQASILKACSEGLDGVLQSLQSKTQKPGSDVLEAVKALKSK